MDNNPTPESRKIRIVVADDEPDLSFLVRIVLEGEGYEVVEARNGFRALERVAAAVTDLVVTDLMMPGMGGAVLIERLRLDPATALIPIVMLSSNPDTTADADAFVTKPFDPIDFVRIINRLTRNAEAGRGSSL